MKHLLQCPVLTATFCPNQRVLLRADLNVPVTNGTIEDDFKLLELQPTLDLLRKQHATIVLITHVGRPDKATTPPLSTALIVSWLQQHGYQASLADNITAAHDAAQRKPGTIIVLENIRTFAGETTGDAAFARELAQLGDYYVNDAFGTLHRNDTSVALVPKLFAPDKCCIGLLVARELATLEPLVSSPAKPFMLIIGGGKVADKLPLIENMLGKADTLLLCPAIAFTFMKACGLPTGASLVDEALVPRCAEMLTKAAALNTKLLMPTDLQVADTTVNGTLSNKKIHKLLSTDIGIALGTESLELYKTELAKAHTVFFNAAMGFAWRPETLHAAQELITELGTLPAYSVIGGGDSVAIARTCKHSTVHLSTGGGATLTYLSGIPLPGLAALCEHGR